MQRIQLKACLGICLLLFTVIWNTPVIGAEEVTFDTTAREKITDGVLHKTLTVMPWLNKINFGFGKYHGIEYLYEKTISKIFFQDKKLDAKVADISIEGSIITLELSHPILGNGTVIFYFSEELIKQTSHQDIQKILLETLGDENHQYVFLDPASKLYHTWSCNHFTNSNHSERMSRSDAERQGYRPSRICFRKVLYLPELAVEKAIEAEWSMRLRNNEAVEKGSDKQAHLSAIGQQVLKNWPFKLLGYDYVFYLTESRAVNAFAIPTGKITVTTAFYDSLDSDDELEALLAYAIANIEQRLSLKKYYDCVEGEEYSNAMKKLGTVASVLAGPAGGGISGALDLALPEESCTPQSLIGYQHENVRQADSMVALYFDVHHKNRQAVVSLIKKLQFSELAEKLHPDLRLNNPVNIGDDSRIARMENIKFKYFNPGRHFVFKREGKPPVQLSLNSQQIFERENKVDVYLDDKALLSPERNQNNHTTIRLSIHDDTGSHTFVLDQDLLTEGVWGYHLTASASRRNEQKFLNNPKKIVLMVGQAGGPTRVQDTQSIIEYTFVPGAIEW